MSGQLRRLKNRIRSVENTQKITRAMEMVAAAKLHRFQDMMQKGRAYAKGLESLLERLSAEENIVLAHPLLEEREEKKAAVILFTSDAGLCGTFNSDLIQMALEFIRSREIPLSLVSVGKFGAAELERKGHSFDRKFGDIRTSQVETFLKELTEYLAELFISKKVDSLYAVSSHVLSLSSFSNNITPLLPIKKPQISPASASSDYIFEPDQTVILNRLAPLFFESKIRQVFLEAYVSEQIARMRAMHQATENAKDMIKALTLKRNKARQAAITKELIEIVSGSEALKS